MITTLGLNLSGTLETSHLGLYQNSTLSGNKHPYDNDCARINESFEGGYILSHQNGFYPYKNSLNSKKVEAFGLRMRGIHLISGSKLIDTVMAIIKQGLSNKLTSRLHVHEDIESVYKVIPKTLLPKDIGGDQDCADKIIKNLFKEFCSPAFIKQMKFLESAAVDESKRLCSKFNEEYSGMPGSFKVMTVD